MTFCTTCGGPLSESGICPNCNPDANEKLSVDGPAQQPPKNNPSTSNPKEPPAQEQSPPQGQSPTQGFSPPPQGYQPPQGFPPPQGQPPPQGYPPPQGFPPPQGYPPPQGFPPPQGYQPSYVYVQSQPSPLAADLVKTLKSFFSVYPQDAVENAANSKTHIWSILAAFSILIGALNIMLVPSGVAGGALSFIYGALFGYGLLYSAVSFFLLAGCIKLIYAVSKVDVSFISVLNLVSASFMFSAILSILAILFSFFLPSASVIFSLAGSLGTLAMLYIGFKTAATFERSPIMIFIVSYTAYLFVLSTIIYLIIMSLINSSGPPMYYYW